MLTILRRLDLCPECMSLASYDDASPIDARLGVGTAASEARVAKIRAALDSIGEISLNAPEREAAPRDFTCDCCGERQHDARSVRYAILGEPIGIGAHGWPLVPSRRFAGEPCLACPECGSHDVMQSVAPGPYGTGPGGRWRMFDRGGVEYAECKACGHRSDR